MRSINTLLGIATCLLALQPGESEAIIPCNGVTYIGLLYAGTMTISLAGSINFGAYNSASSAPAMMTNMITVACTGASLSLTASLPAYTLTLSTGGSGAYSMRKMTASGSTTPLPYNIYTTSTYPGGSVWGDGTGGSVTQGGNGTLLIASQTYIGYGVIPISQRVMAGSYSDIITVTLTF